MTLDSRSDFTQRRCQASYKTGCACFIPTMTCGRSAMICVRKFFRKMLALMSSFDYFETTGVIWPGRSRERLPIEVLNDYNAAAEMNPWTKNAVRIGLTAWDVSQPYDMMKCKNLHVFLLSCILWPSTKFSQKQKFF